MIPFNELPQGKPQTSTGRLPAAHATRLGYLNSRFAVMTILLPHFILSYSISDAIILQASTRQTAGNYTHELRQLAVYAIKLRAKKCGSF